MTEERIITGRYQGSGRGFGFVIPDDGKSRADDCFIPPRREGGAWDGDRVEAEIEPGYHDQPGRRVARVVRILERGSGVVTGTVRKIDRVLWLYPDNERLPGPIRITGKEKIRDGEKAAVEVTSRGSDAVPPAGRLLADFGPAGERAPGVEAILFDKGICRAFSPEAEEQAAAMPQTVPEEALKDREDLRDELIITIDGASSKDLDDAVSLKKEGENWLLGVHIADVSAYVTEGSPLDKEAYDRGTSVYFADQVIPMLPVALSNGICSLNPGVDRLTLSCFMTMDREGRVLRRRVCKSVIRSKYRMTYSDCNLMLTGEGDRALKERLEEEYAPMLSMLRDMAELAGVLEKGRRARGAIDLESQESAVVCDSQGRPVDIVPHTQGVSEKLIESFMLAANETIALHLDEARWPGVFRIHEKPAEEKVETLRAMLSPLGLTLRQPSGGEFQKVLDQVKGRPEAPAVSMMVLRSMMKARYAAEDLGHFGIGADHYCHFTSPIRRYPDLMVHRCLHALMEGNGMRGLAAACGSAADQSSRRELAAQSAERDIEKIYFAEYMGQHLGEEFETVVTGVTRFGLFAALPSGVEGMIPVETLPEDSYVCDETALSLTGERTGARYTLGMSLRVVCVSADQGTGRIEFRLPGRENVKAEGRTPARQVPGKTQAGRTRGGRKPVGKGKGKGGKPAMHVPRRKKGKR